MNYNDSSIETGRRHYYSSSQGPFYNANNIFMFFGGGERGSVVENIIQAVRTEGQVMHVHGERGSGKTMVSLVLCDRLKQRNNIIRYDVPDISISLLLRHLLIELCPQKADLISADQAQRGADQTAIDASIAALIEQLMAPIQTGKPYLFMVDSNTRMDTESLHVLERLSAVRVNNHQIMHCIVFDRITEEEARSYNALRNQQRPGRHFLLRRLTLAEINEYLRHHMILFDFNKRDTFSREMAYFIADRSEGVFRAINTLARNAFTIANLEDAERLSMSHLLMAGLPPRKEPSTESGFLMRHRGGVIAMLGSCVVASAAAAAILLK